MSKITLLIIGFIILFSSCEKDDLSGTLSDVLYVKYNKAEMPAYIYGNGSDKVFIIILHGGPGGKGMEYRLGGVKDLEEHYAVVYFDQRGSGMSSGNYTKSDVTPESMAKDVHALVKVLKYKYGNDIKLFLLGHSWGGALGTEVLLQDQTPFKGWIEVDGGHNLMDLFDALIVRFNEVADEQIAANHSVDYWTDVKQQVEEIGKEGYSDENASTLNQIGFEAEYYLHDDGVLNTQKGASINMLNYIYEESPLIAGINSLTVNGTLSYIWTTLNYTSRLHEITIPSLIMWGKYDLVIPYGLGIEAFDSIGSSVKDTVIFNYSGHSPMANEYEKFTNAMVKFIEANK